MKVGIKEFCKNPCKWFKYASFKDGFFILTKNGKEIGKFILFGWEGKELAPTRTTPKKRSVKVTKPKPVSPGEDIVKLPNSSRKAPEELPQKLPKKKEKFQSYFKKPKK